MQIVQTPRFLEELENVLDYIAFDSIAYSIKFQDELEAKIKTIEFFHPSIVNQQNQKTIL